MLVFENSKSPEFYSNMRWGIFDGHPACRRLVLYYTVSNISNLITALLNAHRKAQEELGFFYNYLSIIRTASLSFVTALVAFENRSRPDDELTAEGATDGTKRRLMNEIAAFNAVAGCIQIVGAMCVYISSVRGYHPKAFRHIFLFVR